MLQRLFERFRPWAEAIAGLDNQQGEYLRMLENRVSRLEREFERLQDYSNTDPVAAMTPTSGAERERRGQT